MKPNKNQRERQVQAHLRAAKTHDAAKSFHLRLADAYRNLQKMDSALKESLLAHEEAMKADRAREQAVRDASQEVDESEETAASTTPQERDSAPNGSRPSTTCER